MGMEMEEDAEDRQLAGRRAAHFFDLILNHHTDAVKRTIRDFPDCVNWRYPQDQTPLMCAVRQKHNDIVDILLRAGAPTGDAIDCGWTALIYAGRDNNPAAFDMLIKHGSSVKERGKNGTTALTQALEGHHSLAALRLIELGADVDATVTGSCFTPLLDAAYSGDAAVCAALIRAGANLAAVDNEGLTALALARRIVEVGCNSDSQKWLETIDVLEPAFAAKAERDRIELREKLVEEMGQGTLQPLNVRPTLKLKQRTPGF